MPAAAEVLCLHGVAPFCGGRCRGGANSSAPSFSALVQWAGGVHALLLAAHFKQSQVVAIDVVQVHDGDEGRPAFGVDAPVVGGGQFDEVFGAAVFDIPGGQAEGAN